MAMHQRDMVIALGDGKARVAVLMAGAERRPAPACAADPLESLEQA